jgi:hypothetical protein
VTVTPSHAPRPKRAATPAGGPEAAGATPARPADRMRAAPSASFRLFAWAGGQARMVPVAGQSPGPRPRTSPLLQLCARVSQPHDPLEREADQVADLVTSPAREARGGWPPAPPVRPAPSIQHFCAPCRRFDAVLVQRACACADDLLVHRAAMLPPARGPPQEDLDAALRSLAGGGTPLPPALRADMEGRFGADFGSVRVHADPSAASVARALHAHAFTHRNHIVLAGSVDPASSGGRRLLAHELTHVIQQGAVTPDVQRLADPRPRARAPPSALVSRGGQAPPVQRDLLDGISDYASAGWERAKGAAAGGVEWLVRRVSPELAEMIALGPGEYLRRAIGRVIQGWISSLIDGLDLSDKVDVVRDSLRDAFESVKQLLTGDARSCAGFVSFLGVLRDFAKSVTENPAVVALKKVLHLVSEVISKITGLVLAPIFDALSYILGGTWRLIERIASSVWGWIKKVKDLASSALDWVLERLGLAGGPEAKEEEGVLARLKRKAAEVWTGIKDALAPVVGPLRTVGKVLLALSPLGPVMLVVKYGPKVVGAIRWLWEHRNDPDIVRTAHEQMGDTILPELLEALGGFKDHLREAADWLVEQAVGLSESLLELLGSITGLPLLDMLRPFVKRAVDAASRLASWAQEELAAAVEWVGSVVAKVRRFVEPYIGVLTSIAVAIINPATIPVLLAGWAWRRLPDCLKGPIIDFLLDIIIGILEAVPDLAVFGPLWAIVKSGVLGFLRGLRAQPTEAKVKVSNKVAKVMTGGSPAFLIGFVIGFLRGVWEGLTDPFKAIWMVLQGLNWVIDFFSGLMARALGAAPASTRAPPGQPAELPVPSMGASSATAPSPAAPAAAADLATASLAPAPSAAVGSGQGEAATLPPDLAARAGEMAKELGPDVGTVLANFWDAVTQYFSEGEGVTFDQLMNRLGEVWSSIRQVVEGAGATLAKKVTDFFMSDTAEEELGDAVGWLVGTIAFQVLLDVITAGTWLAVGPTVRAIARFINWPMEVLGEAFKIIGKLGTFLLDGIKGLARMVRRAASGALKAVVEAVERIGGKLVRYAEEFVSRLGGRAATGAERLAGSETERLAGREAERALGREAGEIAERGAGSAVGEEAERLARQEAERSAKQRAEREAAEAAERRGERAAAEEAQKPLVLAEARAIEIAMEAAGHSISALLVALDALKLRYTWIKSFEADRLGLGYMVYLIASKTPVGPFRPGFERPETFDSLDEARKKAREYAGLGDDAVDFVAEIGPMKGRITGRMSPDGRRGWRVDWDPEKGLHINWWNRTGGISRADWFYGANMVKGGTLDQLYSLLEHFPRL